MSVVCSILQGLRVKCNKQSYDVGGIWLIQAKLWCAAVIRHLGTLYAQRLCVLHVLNVYAYVYVAMYIDSHVR